MQFSIRTLLDADHTHEVGESSRPNVVIRAVVQEHMCDFASASLIHTCSEVNVFDGAATLMRRRHDGAQDGSLSLRRCQPQASHRNRSEGRRGLAWIDRHSA